MLRDMARQVGKVQITQKPTGHVRDLRLPPKSYKEQLMRFKQWKDLRKSEVLKNNSRGEWEKGKRPDGRLLQ